MKKLMKAVAALMLMTAVTFFATGCNKENDDSDVRVTTYTPQDITQTTAKCGGDAIVTQGLSLSELGVCWSTSSKPTVEDAHLSTVNWNEPYVCTITGLEPSTKYHVRAYALRGLEYYYGEDKSFTTEGSNGGGGGGGGGWGSHDYVNLGLPSGLLWATCNVGATTPEGYGDYFAWGETIPKDTYDWCNYKYCNGSPQTLTKYTYPGYGYNGLWDQLTTLLSEDDSATANWGNDWRMPTIFEWEELLQYTTNTWTICNGVKGRLFTASNGNSLFLPAAGGRWGDELRYLGGIGHYWSSSLVDDYPRYARFLLFSSDIAFALVNDISEDRCYGFSVRPVRAN